MVGGKRVRGSKGVEGVEEDDEELEFGKKRKGDVGKSESEKRGERNGERLLCLCLSGGSSAKRDSSSRFGGLWKAVDSSSIRAASDGVPARD